MRAYGFKVQRVRSLAGGSLKAQRFGSRVAGSGLLRSWGVCGNSQNRGTPI